MFCEAILFTFWTTNTGEVCLYQGLTPCIMLAFSNNILKVYLWCYFIDRVSDINMLSMIMILIAFHIKFQYQYFLLILLVRSLLESLLAFFFTYQRFSLAKLVSFYRLYILLNSLLKASVQAKKKYWWYFCICKTYCYNAKNNQKCTIKVSISLAKNSNTLIMSPYFPWRKLKA